MSHLFVSEIHTRQLANGLQVCLVERRNAPVVATALCYRVGTLDEASGQEGIAHFLEHMMFRGSGLFGEGDVDRLTQALGGSNNAYTSHDSTTYFFSFARDRWTTALEIEADRMAGLLLEPAVVESERTIIEEEVKMHLDDPWDALEDEVMAALYGDHPYGRPVLGTRTSLTSLTREALGDFHGEHYTPGNAVLAIVGDVGLEALDMAGRLFEGLPTREPATSRSLGQVAPASHERVQRRAGGVARLLCAMQGPALRDDEFPAMRVLAAMLGAGRASRLHRGLVEESRSCAFVSVEMTETLCAGAILIAAEVIPGVEPRRVEHLVVEQLDRASKGGFEQSELERAKSVLIADWVLGHEQAQEIALTVASAGALMDIDLPARHLEKIRSCTMDEVEHVAALYVNEASRRVVGWSLPESGRS